MLNDCSTLEGSLQHHPLATKQDIEHPDYYVTVQLFGDNKPLTVAARTSYKAFKNHWNWNEWLTLPIKYSNLPSSAQFAITVWGIKSPRKLEAIGGTTMRLFGKHSTLRKGKHKLHLWTKTEADGRTNTTTPSKIEATDDMDKLEKLVKRYDCGNIQPVEWLDNLAFRKIEQIHKKASLSSDSLALYIELPKFDFPVVYGDTEYKLLDPTRIIGDQQTPVPQTNTAIANAMN
ncbi:unnamed protein product [Absidia cylindrospora]